MRGPASSRRPRRVERGAVSWVSLVLLAVLVGGGYLAWVWVPLYFDNYAVRQVVADYMNQAIKNRNDAEQRERMLRKIATIARVDGVDASGKPTKVPAIVLDDRSVVWERDDQARTLRISFE